MRHITDPRFTKTAKQENYLVTNHRANLKPSFTHKREKFYRANAQYLFTKEGVSIQDQIELVNDTFYVSMSGKVIKKTQRASLTPNKSFIKETKEGKFTLVNAYPRNSTSLDNSFALMGFSLQLGRLIFSTFRDITDSSVTNNRIDIDHIREKVDYPLPAKDERVHPKYNDITNLGAMLKENHHKKSGEHKKKRHSDSVTNSKVEIGINERIRIKMLEDLADCGRAPKEREAMLNLYMQLPDK